MKYPWAIVTTKEKRPDPKFSAGYLIDGMSAHAIGIHQLLSNVRASKRTNIQLLTKAAAVYALE
jgi:hypothetical protein